MVMKAEEIVREYKQAKYPEKQIRILADENSCGVSNIKEILLQAGCILPRQRKTRTEAPDTRQTDPKPEASSLPPAPAGAGEYQDAATEPEKKPEEQKPEAAPEEKQTEAAPKENTPVLRSSMFPAQGRPNNRTRTEPKMPVTVEQEEAKAPDIPQLLRLSAVDTIARLLKDSRKTPEDGAAFAEQCRGVLALIHEVEHRLEE